MPERKSLAKLRLDNNLNNFEIGRVISEHKERYVVRTDQDKLLDKQVRYK